MRQLKPKISIVGCGNVGLRYAYATIIQGLAREMILIDINRERLEGEVMDLDHGAPFYAPVDIKAGDYSDTEGSDLIIITAGKNIVPGQTRLDIAKDNVEIFRKIIPEIVKYAPNAVLLVVTNPLDVMTYVAYKLSGKPASEVIGSGTVLDTARFRFLLSKHCDVAAQNVHAYILGEHGDSEFPVWSSATIGGIMFKDYCLVCRKRIDCHRDSELRAIYEDVKNAGYEIIKRKHETSYGIGLAMARITRAVINNENAILPVSVYLEDYLGIDDVYLSVPSVVNSRGIKEILRLKLDSDEMSKLKASADTIKAVIKDTGI